MRVEDGIWMVTGMVCWPTVRLMLWQSICATTLSADSSSISSFGPYNSTPLTRLDRISIS